MLLTLCADMVMSLVMQSVGILPVAASAAASSPLDGMVLKIRYKRSAVTAKDAKEAPTRREVTLEQLEASNLSKSGPGRGLEATARAGARVKKSMCN